MSTWLKCARCKRDMWQGDVGTPRRRVRGCTYCRTVETVPPDVVTVELPDPEPAGEEVPT